MVKIVNDSEADLQQQVDERPLAVENGAQEGSAQEGSAKGVGHSQNHGQQLGPTALLGGVAEAARRLLAIADFDAAVNGALEAIALATGIDRIFIVENHLATSSQPEFGSCPYEWTVPGVVRSREVPGRFPMVYGEIDGFSDWLDALKAGKPVQKTKGEMSDEGQAIQDIDQAFSVLTVPIFVEGAYWGNFGFDDCTTERVWSEAEIAVLETAAASFAGALQRRENMLALEATNQTLRGQDVLLTSVNAAAQCLVANENLAEALPKALRILGEGTRQDRAYLFENIASEDSEEMLWDMPFEWNAPGILSSVEFGMHLPIPTSAFPPQISEPLHQGMHFQCLVRDLEGAALDLNETAQSLSLVGVPIKVSGQWWGVLGFDDCTVERRWSAAEISVLETAATCIGSAIERDRTQKAREAAAAARAAEIEAHNLVLEGRDRILDATAKASNVLLTAESLEESINLALKILGEGIGCDRVGVLENFGSSPTQLPDYQEVIYEWSSPGTLPQISHPEGAKISCKGLEDFVVKYIREDGFGGLVDEWDEPLRSAFISIDIKSSYSVPIWLDNKFWGVIGLDYCKQATRISAAEMAVARTAATCIGSAITRDRTRKEKEEAAKARVAELAERDRILEATASAANVMLTDDNFESAVSKALKIIGEGLTVDRVNLLQHFKEEGKVGYHRGLPNEWVSPGIPVQAEHPELVEISDEGVEFVVEMLQKGEIFGGIVEELPEPFRSGQKALGVKSTYAVPVLLDGQYWGSIGIDDCHHLTRRSDSELEALTTLANCISNAIEKDRSRKEKEAAAKARVAELAERDRILETTAAAANVMLTNDDFDSAVNQALKTVGEGLSVDRIALLQHFDAIAPETVGYGHLLYEWTAENIAKQTEHPELVKISDEGFECVIEDVRKGHIFGGIVEELPEPFRSAQLELDVKSTYAIPILVDSTFWGAITFDDCHQQTRRSESELEALMTLANCIASAIERENTKREKEAAALARANELAERDRILEATAAAANVMLTDDDFDSAVDKALKIVGEGLGVDRVGLMKQFRPTNSSNFGYHCQLNEWTSFGTSLQIAHPELKKISDEGVDFLDSLIQGNVSGGIIDELPEPFRSGQKELGVKSTYAIPIMVNASYWGLIGIDDCHNLTRRSNSELEALMTLANCIGSAIERDITQKAREAAERRVLIERERAARADELEAANQILSVRDRWLETTAAAANELLSATDVTASVKAALATIGQNLACDRVSVMRHILAADAPANELGLVRTLYEWDAEGITAQMGSSELQNIPADGIEDWFRQLMAGQWVGGIVNELEEPFRSGQQALGVKSTYAVPVFVEGEFWGLMGMDHCREARRLSAAELAVFKTAATCVGSAIYQSGVRRDRAAQEQSRLLGRVAEAANLLLRSADYTKVLPEVVRLLGEAVVCDRCTVTQDVIHQPTGQLAVKPLEEWCSEGLFPVAETAPDFLEDGFIPVHGDFSTFHQSLLCGEVVNFLVADLSGQEKAFMEAQGNTSMLIVPIMVQGQCWGQIGFDNCGEPRLYDKAEIAILKVAAESIAAAIARQAQDESVREAEERYRALIELSTEGIYRLELDDPIARDLSVQEQVNLFYQKCYGAEANAAFTAMYGYPNPEDMLGWRLTDIHVEASEQNIKFLSEWLANPDCQISNSESEEMDVDGNIHYFLNNVTGIVEDGYLVRVWGTQTDITELKQAQKAQEAAEKAVLEEREKAARDRATELAKTNEALSTTLSALTETPEPDEFLGQILASICQHIEACTASLFLYDETTHTLNQSLTVQDEQTYQGAAPTDPDMFRHPIPADLSNAWQVITASKKPFTMDERHPENDALMWPESVPWHQAKGHISATCACMKVGNKPIGFIGFAFRHLPTLSDEQLEFIQSLTNQATLSIQLTRLAEDAKQAAILQEQEKAARDRVTELAKTNEAISTTLTTLATSPELDQFLGTILSEMVCPIGAAKAHFFLYDEPTHTLTQRVVIQDGQLYIGASPTDPEMFRHPVSADITPGWNAIISGNKPLTYDETQPYDEEIWWPESIAWHKEQGHKAITCIPLKAGEQPIGYIGFCFYDRTILTDQQLEFMQALANQAIVAIQLTRLAEEAKQTAVLQTQEKAAQQRAAQLTRSNQALKSSLDSLAQQPELDSFLQRVVNEAVIQSGAANGHLFLHDEDAEVSFLHVATDNNGDWRALPDMALWQQPIPKDAAPDFWDLLCQKRPLIVENLQETLHAGPHIWEPSIAWHRNRQHTSFICVPLVLGDRILGFLGLPFIGETTITQDDVELAQALANQATLAIQLTQLADEAKQTALSAALNDERTRLAREIHDTLAQAFTGVSLQLEAAKAAANEDFEDALYHVTRAGNLARQGLSEARRSVRALRSQALETDTLPNALRTALQEMTHSSPTQAHFHLQGTPYALPEDIQTNLLRIGQEATTNTLRHAEANTLTLTLEFGEGQIRMSITDDGKGCQVTSLAEFEGFGLVGMRERVHRFDGQFSFSSTPGKGTVIVIAIPIDHSN